MRTWRAPGVTVAERRRSVRRALLGGVAVCTLVLPAPASAATSDPDCGGGSIRLVQAEAPDISTITAARITGVDAACDGQPVGIQFLGNAEGDPALPATELAQAYSDEDPCTGQDVTGGVLAGGEVEVPLCEGSATSGFVDGRQLTRMRLLTTADAAPVEGGGTPDGAPAPPGTPDPSPTGPLPVTGADALLAALLGALAVLLGTGLVRSVRGARR